MFTILKEKTQRKVDDLEQIIGNCIRNFYAENVFNVIDVDLFEELRTNIINEYERTNVINTLPFRRLRREDVNITEGITGISVYVNFPNSDYLGLYTVNLSFNPTLEPHNLTNFKFLK